VQVQVHHWQNSGTVVQAVKDKYIGLSLESSHFMKNG
jgi:hypothetical protein